MVDLGKVGFVADQDGKLVLDIAALGVQQAARRPRDTW
jgi:hypothetical protein